MQNKGISTPFIIIIIAIVVLAGGLVFYFRYFPKDNLKNEPTTKLKLEGEFAAGPKDIIIEKIIDIINSKCERTANPGAKFYHLSYNDNKQEGKEGNMTDSVGSTKKEK